MIASTEEFATREDTGRVSSSFLLLSASVASLAGTAFDLVKANAAMVFVPSDNTYHGFEARQIDGVRKSLVINFVTNDWRAREQLAFPDMPVA